MAEGRKTGGRTRGVPNKVTANVRAMAGQYGPEVLERLAWLALNGESHAVQVAAGKEILDRAYGKAKQVTEIEGGPAPVYQVVIS
ncbi:hypothetical protein [Gluconacetobacter diazotrophicus]|uniref:hypothetical protein n=1 Tax=Gluconacetobacter diazotrophicus TaxID=33996 RepID=UPI00068071B6|nr:hypothetical protein [Gluconacetobacter diazotrophicus]